MPTLLQRHRAITLLVAVAVPLLVCLLVGSISPTAADEAALILVAVVVAAAATGMRSVGLVAAVAGALSYDFFLSPPYLSLAIFGRNDLETTVLLLVIGVGVTELALWGRRQQERASRQTGYLQGVLDTSATLTSGPATEQVLGQVGDRLHQVLGVDGVRFTDHPPRYAVRLTAEGCRDDSGRLIDVETAGLPTDDVIVLPTGRDGGAFLITSATRVRRISREQCRIAVALADQVGAALNRDVLNRDVLNRDVPNRDVLNHDVLNRDVLDRGPASG